jgi:hypothetical protein
MHEKVRNQYWLKYQIRERTEFEKKGVDEDVLNLRFKHYQNRLIDTLNRILEERRRIKIEQLREETRLQANASSTSPGLSMMPKGPNIMASPIKNTLTIVDRSSGPRGSAIHSPNVLSPLSKTLAFNSNRQSHQFNKT